MLRVLAVCLVVATSNVATAMAEPAEAPSRPPTAGYRLQVLAADVAALALAIGASRVDAGTEQSDMLVLGSIATYFAGAPLVHVAHDRQGRAGASLALRVGSLFAGALIGGTMLPPDRCDCSVGPILGALGGALAATVIDTTLLAGPARPRHAARWRPIVSSTPRTLSIGTRAVAVGVRAAF